MDCLKCTIPQRVITGVMGFLAITIGFTQRACLSLAITEMVLPLNSTKTSNETLMCPVDRASIERTQQSEMNGARYNWNEETQGWILSSFFIGYVISHIIFALFLGEKFGGKLVLSLAILFTTICNIAIPLGVEYGGYMTLIVLRIFMGIASGTNFPALTVLLAAWIPEKERSKLGSLAFGGGQIGNVLSFYISGQLLSTYAWPIIFYFWGFVAVIWFILFTIICSEDPASCKRISKRELDYLKTEMGQLKRHDNLPPTPWKDIFCSVPIWAFIFAQIGQDWLYYIISSDLPKYMKLLGFSVEEIGLYTSLPYLLMWIVSIFSAFLCDYLIDRRYITVTQARKIFTALAAVFPATFIVCASYAGCNKLLVVCWLILSLGFKGNFYPGLKLNSLDLSPNYAGSLMAYTNGAGALAGVVAPVFVGMMTTNSTLEEWRFVFWTTFGFSIIRTIVYSIWGSAEVQPWNSPRKLESHECEKLSATTENEKATEH